jgi:putative membrane protein
VSDAQPTPPPPDAPIPGARRMARERVLASSTLADGEWHRLHPATPLLRGGLAFIAIIGIVIANLRERLVEMFLPQFSEYSYGREDFDPLTYTLNHGYVGWVLLGLVVLLALVVGAFFLSWRMHTFRVTDEAVEVRSGILFRTHRKAKLDRVQGVGLSKPFLPRLVGAARLDVNVAGQSADVKLEYLSTNPAEKLRRDVLTLASGARLAEGEAPLPGAAGPAGTVSASDGPITRHVVERANDFLSPELPEDQAPPESIVRIPVGRLIASTIVNEGTIIVLAAVIFGIVWMSLGNTWVVFTLVPAVLGIGSYYWTAITKSLRYSIAGTPSGVRIGFGLLSTSNDTLPPGRVHAVQISQPLLWRPFGWWQVKINKAGLSAEAAMGGKGNTTVLPVGTLRDATAVVQLMLDGADVDSTYEQVEAAMMRPAQSGFVLAPRRARVIDPIAWRRTGYALRPSLLVFRTGVLWRKLVILPLARIQSIQITQGPVERVLRLSSARVHTVMGPVAAALPTIAKDEAARLFERATAAAVDAAAHDHSHRWASGAR